MSTAAPPAAAEPFTRATLDYALLLLTLTNVVNYLDRSILGVLVEPMRADLSLSDTQIGLMTGIAFALFYAVAGVYLAHLADVRSRVSIISVCMVAWSFMTALTGAAQNFWQLLLARMGVGVGEASVIPAANAMIADYYPPARRPFALAVFTSGTMIGVAAGSFLGGAIAAEHGWRWAFVAAALPGLPLAWIIHRTLQEPQRGAADGIVATASVPFGTAMRLLLGSPVLMLLILSYAFIVLLLFGVIAWFPAFLIRHHGMGLAEVGAWFGLALGAGTAFGGVVGGAIANRLAARDPTWMTRLPMLLLLLIWPLYEIAVFAPTAQLSIFAVALVSVVGGGSYGPVLAAMQTVLPAAVRAKGAALNGVVGSLIGMGGGPLLVGMLSDHYTPTLGAAGALQRGLAITVCAALIGTVLMALAHRAFAATHAR